MSPHRLQLLHPPRHHFPYKQTLLQQWEMSFTAQTLKLDRYPRTCRGAKRWSHCHMLATSIISYYCSKSLQRVHSGLVWAIGPLLWWCRGWTRLNFLILFKNVLPRPCLQCRWCRALGRLPVAHLRGCSLEKLWLCDESTPSWNMQLLITRSLEGPQTMENGFLYEEATFYLNTS